MRIFPLNLSSPGIAVKSRSPSRVSAPVPGTAFAPAEILKSFSWSPFWKS
jgi:hypothetical protein